MQEELGKTAFSILSLLACLVLIRLLASADTMSFFKKNCGQFLDCFHVHNRGIIYSKEHSLSSFGQSKKEMVVVVQ